MASPPSPPENGDQSEFRAEDSSANSSSSPHHKMSPRNRALIFVTAWLIVLMPFLFWWNTWFGRRLPDKQITEYLQDEKHPRHIQHALIQLGERMSRHDAAAARWYPELVRLASHPVEEVRDTDADKVGTAIHQGGLIAKLQVDRSADASQNSQQSIELRSPISGRIHSLFVVPGSHVAAGTEVATVDPGDEQVWEALRALYLIGQPDDLPAIRPYQR